jgi:molybdenum cofactor guanylyltransferase
MLFSPIINICREEASYSLGYAGRRGAEHPQWYHFPVSRAGYVLVGGRSSRMGRDKALLPFRGSTLGRYVADIAAAAAGTAVIVGRPARYASLGYPVIPDRYPREGPLGGILTALAHTAADWNLVLACDMPGISADFLRELIEAAEATATGVLLPCGPSGRPEPLCAIYNRNVREAIEQAFERGERSINAALPVGRITRVTVSQMTPFENVNTPEDWAAYQPLAEAGSSHNGRTALIEDKTLPASNRRERASATGPHAAE